MPKLNVKELKYDARRFGISFSDIADIISKWGPAVLKLIVDGLREGLTLNFLRSILETLGPIFLKKAVEDVKLKGIKHRLHGSHVYEGPVHTNVWDEFDEHWCDHEECPHKFDEEDLKAPAPIIEGEQVESFDEPGNVIFDWIVKLLPELLNKYGQQIMQWLVNLVINALKESKTREAVTAALNNIETQSDD